MDTCHNIGDCMSKSDKSQRDALPGTLQRWREALPEERMAHLVKDTARGFSRSLQARLREHSVQYGHWTFLRILWQTDGLTQRQLSEQAGFAEPTTFSALKAMEAIGATHIFTAPWDVYNPYLSREEKIDAVKRFGDTVIVKYA